jgi:photosystem II stability/assembly factor-like uncharacterized protein
MIVATTGKRVSPKEASTMRQLVCRVLVLILCLVLACSGVLIGVSAARAADAGVWIQLPPYGGDVYCLAIDPLFPATLYAGTMGAGVFRSTDSGSTWTAVNTGLANPNALRLAIDPDVRDTLYAGTYGGGVFRSMDSGDHWTGMNAGLSDQNVTALAIDPLTPATLYAGTDGGGIFRSTDGGAHWTKVSSGLGNMKVYCLAIDPRTPSVLYAGTYGGGVFRSIDSGATWTAVNTGLTNQYVSSIAIHPTILTTLYVGTYGGGVCRSTNGGTTWNAANTGLTSQDVRSVVIHPTTPTTLYAGTYGGGVCRSTDSGATWTAVNAGLSNTNVRPVAIGSLTPTRLYAGTEGAGVFRYEVASLSSCVLTTAALPAAGGSVRRVPDAASYTPGTVVTLTAIPAADYPFTGWSGDLAGSANPATIVMDGDKNVTALFVVAPTMTSSDLGGAYTAGVSREFHTTMNNPASGIRYNSVAFKFRITSASPKDVSQLAIWNGSWQNVPLSADGSDLIGVCAGDGWFLDPGTAPGDTWHVTFNGARSYSVTVTLVDHTNGDAPLSTLTGLFSDVASYTLTPTAGTGGTIAPSTPQAVLPGGSKTFTMSPSSGYRIAGVSVDGVSQGAISSYSFTNVTSNHTISARFEQEKKQTVIVLQIGNSRFTVNGGSVTLDSPPVIKNGRTLVPIRAIIEALGGTVGWDGTARKATVTLGGTTIELWIGRSTATVNGTSTPIDAANTKVVPEIISSRTMLPLRFVSENLGCSIVWADATKTITITYEQ